MQNYSDVNLLDLAKIAKKCWPDISKSLGSYFSSKRFKKDFDRLNEIRKGLFHPAKGYVFTEDGFQFARDVRKTLLPPDSP